MADMVEDMVEDPVADVEPDEEAIRGAGSSLDQKARVAAAQLHLHLGARPLPDEKNSVLRACAEQTSVGITRRASIQDGGVGIVHAL